MHKIEIPKKSLKMIILILQSIGVATGTKKTILKCINYLLIIYAKEKRKTKLIILFTDEEKFIRNNEMVYDMY